ncbi:MAG: toll/interleukin-1 receptor domain-containing protein [Promethearchaeota archaeon]
MSYPSFKKPTWQREYDNKSLIHLEEVIYTSSEVPKNPDRFFSYFIKNIESKQIPFQNQLLEINKIGPLNGYSTKFQLLSLNMIEIQFSIRFKIMSEQTNTYFDLKITTMKKKMSMNTKSIFKQIDKIISSKLIQVIKIITDKSIDYINSTPNGIVKPSKVIKGEGVLVFVSYSTKDALPFRIEEIADDLSKTEEIDDVLYWQEDNKDNIIEYMNENLGNCDVVLLFCSPNSLNSIPVQKEWTAAEGLSKPIIPVFINTAHIPPLLNTREGVEFDTFDHEKNVKKIHELIIKKSQLNQ